MKIFYEIYTKYTLVANCTIRSFMVESMKIGSLGFGVKGSGFGGVSVRTHAHTPKSGYPPRKFPVSLKIISYGEVSYERK
jgi:hypothetical protein